MIRHGQPSPGSDTSTLRDEDTTAGGDESSPPAPGRSRFVTHVAEQPPRFYGPRPTQAAQEADPDVLEERVLTLLARWERESRDRPDPTLDRCIAQLLGTLDPASEILDDRNAGVTAEGVTPLEGPIVLDNPPEGAAMDEVRRRLRVRK